MYEEHPVFIQPDGEEARVWRYMDFTKLVSLFDTRSLYFARADRFEDPFEGSWPQGFLAALKPEAHQAMPEDRSGFADIVRFQRRTVFMNCWHMNEQESAAMWGLHLKSDEGVAIQSTYGKLKKSLIAEEEVFLGMVQYIDYDTERFHYVPNKTNMLSAFVHKRKSFVHEQEARAIVYRKPVVSKTLTGEKHIDLDQSTMPNGLQIEVDNEALIERIYVAPTAPAWFADLVRSVMKKYEYRFEVVQSRLAEDPVF